MGAKQYLTAGGILMIIVGLARGAGGAALLARGGAADPAIKAGSATVFGAALSLLLLAMLLVVTGVGVLRRRRASWLVGAVGTVAFVLGGAFNGFALYGRPQVAGTAGNVAAAAMIIMCLMLGRGALEDRAGN